MSRAIRVLWTISPKTYPQPWRTCSRCGEQRSFRCSGKFRLNANGKRLDAWLIYKCTMCDDSWNRTIFERRAARDCPPEMLAALQANDEALVRRFAFDLTGLKRLSCRVDQFADVEIAKEVLANEPADMDLLEVVLAIPMPISLRLDRLLATELKLARSRVAELADVGSLGTSNPLGKPARDGTRICIKLTGVCSEASPLVCGASAQAAAWADKDCADRHT